MYKRQIQIGISNDIERRLKKHFSRGWEQIDLRGPMDGLLAREWETSILQMLEHRGVKLSIDTVAGKFDGYTESWLSESFSANSLRELMDAVQANED